MIANAKRKARELECFDFKNKKQNSEENISKKHKLVKSFKALPLASLVTPEQKLHAVRKCMEDFGY